MSKPGSYAILDTANPLAAGVRHYWPLNEGSGAVARDLGSGGSNGTLTNASMWDTTTEASGAVVTFNTNYRVDLGTPTLPAVGSYYIRYRTTSSFVAALLANETTDNSQGFALNLYLGTAYWTERESNVANAYGGSGLADGGWHTLVYVASGSGATLYADGSAITLTGAAQVHVARTLQAWLGYMHDAGTDYWMVGAVDQVIISADVWDAATVAFLQTSPYQLLTTGPLTAAPAPNIIRHTSVSAKATWVSATGGAGPVTNTLEWSQDAGATWHSAGTTPGTTRITGLQPSAATLVRVTSTDGTTPVHSTNASFTTDPPIVPAPLFKTATRAARWAALWAAGGWEASYLASQSAAEVLGNVDSANGSYSAFIYLITGDTTYAQRAWDTLTTISPILTPNPGPLGRNAVRGQYLDLCILYSWLYSWMDSTKKTQYQNALLGWAEWSIGDATLYDGDFNTGDSDQTAAQYIGLALTDAFLGTDYLEQTTLQNLVPVGGLDDTAADIATARNALAYYASKSAGGIWPVGSEYSTEDSYMALLYAEAIISAYGVDHLSEISALLPDLCLAAVHEMTPDLAMDVQWGDDEHPRDPAPKSRIIKYMVMAGLASEKGLGIAPVMQAFVQALHALAGTSADPTSYWKKPYEGAWPFLFWDRSAPTDASWRASLPRYTRGRGMGISMLRSGTDAQSAQVTLHGGNPIGFDHEMLGLRDFQIYRKGEWVFTHPACYLSGFSKGETINTFLHKGLGLMREQWGTQAQEAGAGYHLVRCGTSGKFYYPTRAESPSGFYDPPDPFVSEYTGTLFYLPSTTFGSETLLIFDRVNSVEPSTVYGYAAGRYNAGGANNVQYLMDNLAAPVFDVTATPSRPVPLKLAQFHAPVNPSTAGNAFSWNTTGGQHCRITTLLPASATRQVLDDFTRTDLTWNDPAPTNNQQRIANSEHGFTLFVYPTTDTQFATFLHTAQVYDTGVTLANTLVQSGSGEAQGALVQRTGESDVLVLFSAQSSGRKLTAGYTVSFTPATATSDAYLLDLDPLRTWSATINGGAPVAIAVTPAGVGHLAITGAGATTIVLSAVNTPATLTAGTLTAPVHSSAGALLTWTPATGGVAAPQDTLERSTNGGSSWVSTGQTAQPASDAGLTPGSTVLYRVAQTDGATTVHTNPPVSVTLDGATGGGGTPGSGPAHRLHTYPRGMTRGMLRGMA